MKIYSTTPEHYRLYIFTYGIISLIFVLEQFVDNENYEECGKIIKAIKIHEKYLNEPMFTELNYDNIKKVANEFIALGCVEMTFEKTFESCFFYCELIVQEINKKYLIKTN